MQLLDSTDIDRMLGDVLASGMPPGRPAPNPAGGGDAPDSGDGAALPEEAAEEEANPS
jgi:hypothetical protein